MRAYGLITKRSSAKIHSHNKCGTCSSHPSTKGSARMKQKVDIRLELKDLNSLQDGYDPEFWDWADAEFICGCEIEWEEWDRILKQNKPH